MNLIEQLGGYEKAKIIIISNEDGDNFYSNYYEYYSDNNVYEDSINIMDIEKSLLEYRRENSIFDFGDKVYGVGINDRSRPAYFDNKATKEYDHWIGMLERCYGKNKHIKSRQTYQSCECSENFKSYSYFYDWCQNQIGFNEKGWQLDKDILIEGNKLYSEDTCVFVPCDINNFLTNRKKQNKSGYIGVSFHKASGKYATQISFGGKRKHLGLFENPKDGEDFYFLVKSRMAIELIEKYKSNLDERVIKALLSRYRAEEIKFGHRI